MKINFTTEEFVDSRSVVARGGAQRTHGRMPLPQQRDSDNNLKLIIQPSFAKLCVHFTTTRQKHTHTKRIGNVCTRASTILKSVSLLTGSLLSNDALHIVRLSPL